MLRLLPLLALLGANPPDATVAPDEAAQPTSARVLDRIVAIIDRQPLLQSQLEFEARVALIAQGGLEAATAPLGAEELGATLHYVIGQRLAHAEADRLQVFAVPADEVAAAVKGFAQRFPTEAHYRQFLLTHEASEDQLALILRRELRVARYLDSKIKLGARVGEEELRRYYRDHPEAFEGLTYPRAREAIKAQLTRERYRTLARRHLDDLLARSDVRLLAGFGRGPGPGGSAAPPAEPPSSAPEGAKN